MTPASMPTDTERYARCIKASKKVRWDIDAHVLRGRELGSSNKFLPDGLSLVAEMEDLSADEQRVMSQVQGRTYANMFGLVERFIGAKVLEIGADYALGDQVALEALVRFGDEELKHQELFRRVEALAGRAMPPGYVFRADSNGVARAVLSKSSWAVLALTCQIELFTQAHYTQSLDSDPSVAEVYRDVFRFHWQEECQHAVLDELEWRREDARLSADERDAAIDDLIALIGAVDGVLREQAAADTDYFVAVCGRVVGAAERGRIEAGVLRAYRWQYIVSGVEHPRFARVLGELVTDAQLARIRAGLAAIG